MSGAWACAGGWTAPSRCCASVRETVIAALPRADSTLRWRDTR